MRFSRFMGPSLLRPQCLGFWHDADPTKSFSSVLRSGRKLERWQRTKIRPRMPLWRSIESASAVSMLTTTMCTIKKQDATTIKRMTVPRASFVLLLLSTLLSALSGLNTIQTRKLVVCPTHLSSSSSCPTKLYQSPKINNGDKDDNHDGWSDESLETLQYERKESSSSSSTDRDMFIPIFTIVSLAGLLGSYGYEILRLYSRGELYLPWNH